jgi:hypothetical protein
MAYTCLNVTWLAVLPKRFSFVLRCLTMSESLERHLFGDSNIVRFLPKLQEAKSDPSIKAVSMTKSTNSVLLRDALSSPTSAYPIIIIAALTNLITAKFFEDYDLLVEHCKAVFNDVLLWVQEGRDSLDGFATLVSYQRCKSLDMPWLPSFLQIATWYLSL